MGTAKLHLNHHSLTLKGHNMQHVVIWVNIFQSEKTIEI